MGKQLDASKTGWANNMLTLFKDFAHFKEWYDPRYKGTKAETIWKKIGGKIEKEKPQE